MKTQSDNSDEITSFRELMDMICYDWSFDDRNLYYDNKVNMYILNKTTIEIDCVTYKTECYPLAKGIFDKLNKFYELLED